jgi:N-acetylglucosaminyldiphosphoundecaprenol N-acetyl-beta-D-mannosaminyltransferase
LEENVTKAKRVSFLNVPVDIIDNESLFEAIEGSIQNGQRKYIVFLTIDKVLKARRDAEYNRYLREASLILPVSLGIIHGLRFQKKGEAFRYNPYELIIKLCMTVEKLNKNLYLLGSHIEDLLEAEKNLKVSFPQLKIIGRCAGYFNREKEIDIITAVKKSSPSLIFLGKGLPGKEKWILRNVKDMHPSLYVWIKNYLEIFSGKEKNSSKKLFKMGLETWAGFSHRPWRILKVVPYLYFKLLVLIYRIFGL